MNNFRDKSRGLTGLHTALEGLLSTIEQIPVSGGGGGGSATDANFIDWVGRVAISTLTTTAKTVKGAINELKNGVDDALSNTENLDSAIGDTTALDTTDKSNVVAAINEVCTDLIVSETVIFSNVGYEAGAVGSRGISESRSVTKAGYTPVAATVTTTTSSANYIVTPLLSGDLLYCIGYRTKSSAVSGQSITVRVTYVRDF